MAGRRRDSAAVGSLHEMASANDLKKALQCPICEEVPLAPIYTCSSGHSICGKCREELKCGLCGEDLSNGRNKAVELIVASSSFWCKYMSDGCPEVVKGSEYRSHADVCDFRRIKCFEWEVNKCKGEEIRFKDYFKHLKSQHEIDGFTLRTNYLTMSEYSNCLTTDGPWPAFYFEYEEDIFLRNMKIEESILYMWFTMIGSESDAANYQVRISVYMKHSEASRCDWILPVYSVRKTEEEIETSAFRLSIPALQLERYCTQRAHPHGEMYRYVFDLRYEMIPVT